jgi:hypothetical protein
MTKVLRHRYLLVPLFIVVFVQTAAAQIVVPQLGQQSLSNSSYIIDKNGKLWAWGANESGELGIANTTDQNIPVQVALPLGSGAWVRLAAGAHHALAVADSDRLYAWGSNHDGQLGIGSTTEQHAPARVTNPSGVTSWRRISAGEDHSVALASNGMLYAWGNNSRGQLGTGDLVSYNSPHIVALPSGVRGWLAVAAGAGFTLAITDRGELYGWGYDSSGTWGQLGVNQPIKIRADMMGDTWLPGLAASTRAIMAVTNTGDVLTPGLSTPESGKIAVAMGAGHRLYLDGNTRLSARGDNLYGQLGADDPFANSNSILMPLGVTQWVAIAAGLRHSLALGNDGNLYSWGDNTHGQLGTGNLQSQHGPQVIRSFTESLKFASSISTAGADTDRTLTAAIHDTAIATLTNPSAYLSAPYPIEVQDGPLIAMFPFTLASGDTAKARWQLTVDSTASTSGEVITYVYLSSIGSAPRIVVQPIHVSPGSSTRVFTAHVIDSITKKPIAQVLIHGSGTQTLRYITDSTGAFQATLVTDPFTATAYKENYSSKSFSFTLNDIPSATVELAPAPVVANWTAAPAKRFDRIAVIDSIHLYAIADKTIYYSNDAGLSWTPAYVADDTLHSIAFLNRNAGFAVGDHGLIVGIDAMSNSCNAISGLGLRFRLNDIATANGTAWIAGDSGVVMRYLHNGAWSKESVPGVNLLHVNAIDDNEAVVVSGNYVAKRTLAGWKKLNIGVTTFGYPASYCPEPDLLYIVDASGNIRYTYPSDPSLGATYVGSIDHPADQIYFINKFIGLASCDTATSITYDGGETWARVLNAGRRSNTLDVAGLRGYFSLNDSIAKYSMVSGPLTAVLTGRFIDRDGITGIAGGKVTLHGMDGNQYVTHTTEKGYYVLSGLPVGVSPQGYEFVFSDSLGTWTKSESVVLHGGDVATSDFVHPMTADVSRNTREFSEASIRCTHNGRNELVFETEGIAQNKNVYIADVLGRSIVNIAVSSPRILLTNLALTPGVYYCIVSDANGGRASCRFVVEK